MREPHKNESYMVLCLRLASYSGSKRFQRSAIMNPALSWSRLIFLPCWLMVSILRSIRTCVTYSFTYAGAPKSQNRALMEWPLRVGSIDCPSNLSSFAEEPDESLSLKLQRIQQVSAC